MKLRESIKERVTLIRARLRAWWGRVTVSGLWLRAAAWVFGTLALLLAAPAEFRGSYGLIVAGLVPLLATARPDGIFAWATPLLAVTSWVGVTLASGQAPLPQAAAIGVTLYIHHSCLTLAASWRADASVRGQVWRDWFWRLATVLCAALLVTLALAVLMWQPLPIAGSVLLIAGVLGALGSCVTIVYLLHRR